MYMLLVTHQSMPLVPARWNMANTSCCFATILKVEGTVSSVGFKRNDVTSIFRASYWQSCRILFCNESAITAESPCGTCVSPLAVSADCDMSQSLPNTWVNKMKTQHKHCWAPNNISTFRTEKISHKHGVFIVLPVCFEVWKHLDVYNAYKSIYMYKPG